MTSRRILLTAAAPALLLSAQEAWLPPSGTERPPAAQGDRRLFLEAGWTENGTGRHGQRQGWNLGLDGLSSDRLSARVYATVNGRLDWDSGPEAGGSRGVSLTLREAYLSWRPSERWTLDAGRMQVRDGVALGFNPTDVFRLDALLARRTADPNRLKESRLGVVAGRAQYLDEGRGATLVLVPEVRAGGMRDRWFDPQVAATNSLAQAYLKVMPGSFASIYPNLILDADQQGGRLLGLNLTRSIGAATVLYAEGARARRSAHAGGDGAWFGQAAIGASYATPWRQNLALEYRSNGAQPSLQDAARWQEPAARQSLMAHLSWDRFLSRSGTLTGLFQKDLRGGRDFLWLEWACHHRRASFSFSGSHDLAGMPWSLFATLRVYLN